MPTPTANTTLASGAADAMATAATMDDGLNMLSEPILVVAFLELS